MVATNREVLIGLCKYVLLFVCLSRIVAPVLGVVLGSIQTKPVCIEFIELESEDNDCKGDISKKASIKECFDCFYHFKFQKCLVTSTLFEFIIINEGIVQCFYPDVLTPPPIV